MFLFFIILLLFFFGSIAWQRIDWGVYGIIVLLPTYLVRFSLFEVPMTMLEGMILVLVAIWLLKKLQAKSEKLKIKEDFLKRLRTTNYELPVTLFIVAGTIAVFVAPELLSAAGIWKAYIIEPILFLVVFIDTIRTKQELVGVLWALGFSMLVPGVFAIYQKFTGVFIPNEFWQAAATRRVTSFYGFPNAIGLYFAPIVAGLIGLAAHKLVGLLWPHTVQEKPRKALIKLLIISFGIVVGGYSIWFAQSKGALLGILAAVLFYAIVWKGKRVLFSGILLVTLLIGFISPSFVDIQGQPTVSGGGSLEVRVSQWEETWDMLKTRPVLGAGLSGYQTRVALFHKKDYIEIFMYPHNIVLNFWSEMGLLGLIAFVWIVVLFFVYFRHAYVQEVPAQRHVPVAIAGMMVALLTHGLVDVPYFKNDLSILFWVIAGLVVVYCRLHRGQHLKN